MKARFWKIAMVLGLVTVLWTGAPAALTHAASEDSHAESGDERGVGSRIADAVKKVWKKIEEGFTKAADKLEKKRVGEKIDRKLNKAAKKTAEGFEKAGKKIEQKLGD
jgi:hypothetical protein